MGMYIFTIRKWLFEMRCLSCVILSVHCATCVCVCVCHVRAINHESYRVCCGLRWSYMCAEARAMDVRCGEPGVYGYDPATS